MQILTDLMIRIDPRSDVEQIGAVYQQLKTLEGIKHVTRGARVGNIIRVEYDADRIRGPKIMEFVRQNGLKGDLIGM